MEKRHKNDKVSEGHKDPKTPNTKRNNSSVLRPIKGPKLQSNRDIAGTTVHTDESEYIDENPIDKGPPVQ